ERAPFVDVVFGPQTLHRLPELLAARQRQQRPQVDISFPEIEKFDHLPPAKVEGASAFVSIMEGCSKYCSYCVVPYTRGEEVSRPFDDVLTEIAGLADQGVMEINLLGQNVNAYRGKMGDTSEFADLAVQHGSDRILMAMKRGYTALEFKSIVRKLRAIRPDLRLASDFIVGFPGETDEDHAKTMQLVRDIGFDASFSFIFSPRPGTPAANLADDTPHEVKVRRLQELQAEIEATAIRYNH